MVEFTEKYAGVKKKEGHGETPYLTYSRTALMSVQSQHSSKVGRTLLTMEVRTIIEPVSFVVSIVISTLVATGFACATHLTSGELV